MSVGTRVRRAWLGLIGVSLNRLTLRIARSSHGPFTIVRHVGRKTGLTRETPLIVQPIPHGFVIALTYGPDVQWYRNVLAAGGCTLVRHRIEHEIVAVEPMGAAEATAAFPPPQRFVLRLLRRRDFARFVAA